MSKLTTDKYMWPPIDRPGYVIHRLAKDAGYTPLDVSNAWPEHPQLWWDIIEKLEDRADTALSIASLEELIDEVSERLTTATPDKIKELLTDGMIPGFQMNGDHLSYICVAPWEDEES